LVNTLERYQSLDNITLEVEGDESSSFVQNWRGTGPFCL